MSTRCVCRHPIRVGCLRCGGAVILTSNLSTPFCVTCVAELEAAAMPVDNGRRYSGRVDLVGDRFARILCTELATFVHCWPGSTPAGRAEAGP